MRNKLCTITRAELDDAAPRKRSASGTDRGSLKVSQRFTHRASVAPAGEIPADQRLEKRNVIGVVRPQSVGEVQVGSRGEPRSAVSPAPRQVVVRTSEPHDRLPATPSMCHVSSGVGVGFEPLSAAM